jgi:hypothetical protein
VYEPPSGLDDMIGDADQWECWERNPAKFHDLEVEGVGIVKARRPMVNAIPALAMAANAQIEVSSRVDYLVLFVRNHLAEGEMERIYVEMISGEAPADSIDRIARAVATWGTARPTSPSSR